MPPTPRLPTPTHGPNYRAMAQTLINPLSTLIVATRNNSPTVLARRAEFDAAADSVLIPRLEGDFSETANRLRGEIRRVQNSPDNLAELELARERLLDIR